jgi:hypothetical protein
VAGFELGMHPFTHDFITLLLLGGKCYGPSVIVPPCVKRGRLDSHYSCFEAVTGSRPAVAGNRGAASAISGEWRPLACGLHRNFGSDNMSGIKNM